MRDPKRLSDDIDAEIADHLERRVADLRRAGVSEREARAHAAEEFGDVADAKRMLLRIDARRERRERGRLLSGLTSDVRFAVRRLATQRAATGLTIATLALAIGVAAAVYTVVDQLILRPPPFPHADRLVDVWHAFGPDHQRGSPLQSAEIVAWRQQPAVFERLETFAGVHVDMTVGDVTIPVIARVVSLGLFDMLGIRPLLGRSFTSHDGAPGSEKVLMLGHAFWRSHFNGSPSALGARIVLNDERYTVVGVLPKGTMLINDDEPVWLPIDLAAWGDKAPRYGFRGIGRLTPGLDLPGARAASNQIAKVMNVRAPLPRSWYLAILEKQGAEVRSETRRVLFVLLGAVGLLLLLACVNVTSLAVGQAMKRARERQLRAAIGASRWRLMRELLVEAMLVAIAAGAAGIAIAHGALEVLLALAPDGLVLSSTRVVEIDTIVLAVIATATLGVGFLTGLVPAMVSSRFEPAQALREAMRGSARGSSLSGSLGALIVVEVALAAMLLVGAALMSRTLVSFYSLVPGFDVDRLVTVRLELPGDRYPTEQARRAFFAELDTRLRAQPGIEQSAYALGSPPNWGYGSGGSFELEDGREVDVPPYAANMISPSYFETAGIPVLAGRTFDYKDGDHTVILSRAFADLLSPGHPVVGRRVRELPEGSWYTIVGVVENVEARSLDERTPLYWYSPIPWPLAWEESVQSSRRYVPQTLIVRARNPVAAIPAIRAEIAAVDSRQPVGEFELGTQIYAEPFAQQQFLLTVMGTFAGIALLLAAMGIFGVLSQAVTQRRREIGIRVALGAGYARLVRMLVGRGLALAAVGVLVGTGGALAGVRTLEGLLFGVSPFDPVSFASVAALMLLVALAACWWPTRRALAVEPAEVLRSE